MHFANLKIGHATHTAQGTGLSVFLLEKPAPCGHWLCGSAPAMRDVSLLDPACTVNQIDALLFTGGSAFGLDAAQGVMRWLAENQRGFPTKYGNVPIVPTASIYDFSVKGMHIPTADDAYQACANALQNNQQSGQIGAGTGASVGKLVSTASSMSGGLGHAKIQCPSGLEVWAFTVVNAVGDILDQTGTIIAGAQQDNGEFINLAHHLMQGGTTHTPLTQQNTPLAAVFTNAKLDKNQLTRIAKMASAGFARAITPAFTSYDGDAVFTVSLGDKMFDEITIGIICATAIQQAIIQAVKTTTIIK